jgi:hypothetical protein
MLAAGVFLIALLGGTAPATLPAYAHNDYENARPLERALELGFRGVEVDYYVVDGELRAGHDPPDLRPGRTVESLYLAPLRERWRRDGEILPGGETFILNIESKREGVETYEALHALLAQYEDILTVVRGGKVEPGPVQVILVGWYPPLEYLAAQPVRYAAVQSHYSNLPADHERYPAHLLKLISQNYKQGMFTRGAGRMSPRMRKRLTRVVAAAHAVPGRISRVFNVPRNTATCRAILDAGVDLIGSKDIEGMHATLERVLSE